MTTNRKRYRTVSNFIDLIQFHLICQILAKFSEVESKKTATTLEKQKGKFLLSCSPTPQSGRMKLGSFMSLSCNDG